MHYSWKLLNLFHKFLKLWSVLQCVLSGCVSILRMDGWMDGWMELCALSKVQIHRVNVGVQKKNKQRGKKSNPYRTLKSMGGGGRLLLLSSLRPWSEHFVRQWTRTVNKYTMRSRLMQCKIHINKSITHFLMSEKIITWPHIFLGLISFFPLTLATSCLMFCWLPTFRN